MENYQAEPFIFVDEAATKANITPLYGAGVLNANAAMAKRYAIGARRRCFLPYGRLARVRA